MNVQPVDYPVYDIAFDTSKGFLVAVGGGGPSKTGVKNVVTLFKFDYESLRVEKLSELSTSSEAPMNISINPKNCSSFLVGVNDRCWMVECAEDYRLSLVKSFTTDFSDEGYQKVSGFSPEGSKFFTGSIDGSIRIWNYPAATKLKEIDLGHEIVDAVTISGKLAVTDGYNIILMDWNGKKLIRRKADPSFGFRCLTAVKSSLLAVENSSDRKLALLSVLSTNADFKLKQRHQLKIRAITCIASLENFLVFGSADGTIAVYTINLETGNLQQLAIRKAYHSFAVTSVELTRSFGDSLVVFSGSADGTIRCLKVNTGNQNFFIVLLFYVLALIPVGTAIMVCLFPEEWQKLYQEASVLIDNIGNKFGKKAIF